jgi:probable F420-dependent oxidoreductase
MASSMSKVELGSIGAVVSPGTGDAFVRTSVALEDLGYSTIWLTGGPLENLGQIAEVVRATEHVRVATGIISVDRFGVDEVGELYTELEADYPGRFIVGLGGAHGPKPVSTLTAYLERLMAVPPSARVMAALGPRMLDLAREHAAGALAVLVTPEYTAQSRALLGDDTALAIEQLVVVDTDPDRARAIAHGPLGFLAQVPAYQANFRRMGFDEEEITQLADRLVDSLVWWGDADSIAARVGGHLRAGADHVAISVTTAAPEDDALDHWRQLADGLSLIRS